MSPRIDPELEARREAAVRTTRRLLPAYGLLILLLFGPGVLNAFTGSGMLPYPWASVLSIGSLVLAVLVLVVWFLRISALGQWRPGGGPRFSVLIAIIEGTWSSTDPDGAAPRPGPSGISPGSPLGVLAADVAECVQRLELRQPALTAALATALREADGVAILLTGPLAGRNELAAAARTAIGRFEDHVQQLRRGDADVGADWAARLEADIAGLRAAGDALRLPSRPADRDAAEQPAPAAEPDKEA